MNIEQRAREIARPCADAYQHTPICRSSREYEGILDSFTACALTALRESEARIAELEGLLSPFAKMHCNDVQCDCNNCAANKALPNEPGGE